MMMRMRRKLRRRAACSPGQSIKQSKCSLKGSVALDKVMIRWLRSETGWRIPTRGGGRATRNGNLNDYKGKPTAENSKGRQPRETWAPSAQHANSTQSDQEICIDPHWGASLIRKQGANQVYTTPVHSFHTSIVHYTGCHDDRAEEVPTHDMQRSEGDVRVGRSGVAMAGRLEEGSSPFSRSDHKCPPLSRYCCRP